MATKCGRMVAYFDRVLPIKSHDIINTMSVAINHGMVGIYNEELPSMKSSDTLIKWSFKVT